MDPLIKDLTKKLKERKIRPSYQRLKILEYLATHRTHPTVNQIYEDLRKEVPTLSKATVYNGLHALEKQNLIRVLNIDEGEARYDFTVTEHGHFKCKRCGTIFDFSLEPGRPHIEELKGFKITSRDFNLKGLCPECLAAKS
jgi:Fur family peroxide stress response transcriptional regulator